MGLGLDLGQTRLVDLEHLALQVHQHALPDARLICTHIVPTGRPHDAASFEVSCAVEDVPALLEQSPTSPPGVGDRAASRRRPVRQPRAGSPAFAAGAALAAADHRARRGGRAIRFPGQDHLPEVVEVAWLLATSAIQRLHGLGCQVTPDALVDPGGFLRPVYRDGALCLTVTPGIAGRLRPFEVEHPTSVAAATDHLGHLGRVAGVRGGGGYCHLWLRRSAGGHGRGSGAGP